MALRARGLKNLDDLVAAGLGQMIREKSAIAHNDSKCHYSLRCHIVHSLVVLPVSRWNSAARLDSLVSDLSLRHANFPLE